MLIGHQTEMPAMKNTHFSTFQKSDFKFTFILTLQLKPDVEDMQL